jgi:hypothetical protein
MMLCNGLLSLRSLSSSSGTGTPIVGRDAAGLGTEFESRMHRASRLREMAHSPVVQSSTSPVVVTFDQATSSFGRLGVPPASVAPRRADGKGLSPDSPATTSPNEPRGARSGLSTGDRSPDGGTSPAIVKNKPPPSPQRAGREGTGTGQKADKRPEEAWSDYYARRAAGN